MAKGGSHSFVLMEGKDRVKYNLMGVDENDAEYQINMTIDPKAKKEFTWAFEPGDVKKAK